MRINDRKQFFIIFPLIENKRNVATIKQCNFNRITLYTNNPPLLKIALPVDFKESYTFKNKINNPGMANQCKFFLSDTE